MSAVLTAQDEPRVIRSIRVDNVSVELTEHRNGLTCIYRVTTILAGILGERVMGQERGERDTGEETHERGERSESPERGSGGVHNKNPTYRISNSYTHYDRAMSAWRREAHELCQLYNEPPSLIF